jgi:group II intron reverse transcriptase/maturase
MKSKLRCQVVSRLLRRWHLRALARAYGRLRSDAALGVDGVTKESYGQDLLDNLQDLHERLKSQRWRHQPIRRVHIPKENGQTRPLGIAAFEDKIVQDALREVPEAIYEADFLDASYGFRPTRSAHDALRAVHRAADQGVLNWVLEADLMSFFDSLDRQRLKEILQERVADGSLLRLIGKCLQVGVLDGEVHTTPDSGTAQGSVLSPSARQIRLPARRSSLGR